MSQASEQICTGTRLWRHRRWLHYGGTGENHSGLPKDVEGGFKAVHVSALADFPAVEPQGILMIIRVPLILRIKSVNP